MNEFKGTKGNWHAHLRGTLSKVKTEGGTLIGWGLGCEKHYNEDLRDVKNETWLSFRKRTEPLRERQEKETEANAKLIAAAPDLLEALMSIENDDKSIPKAIWDMRNAAIKKATE